jgi:DNA-nicking Smr family endonuclease
MPRRRSLGPEEEDLWQAVARTVRPMPGRRPRSGPASPDPSAPAAEAPAPHRPEQPRHEPDPARLTPFHVGEKAVARPPAPHPAPAPALRMDAKTHARMTRGKLAPEARIDLHGMTVAEAHAELIRFILNAQSDGLRLVLVITGKGKTGPDGGPMSGRTGLLRQQVPHWLHLPPLGPAVQQVAGAHQRHGGGGACYVYLRRR